jgi:hypothetical protein
VGDRDLMFSFPGVQRALPGLKASIPNLVEMIVLPAAATGPSRNGPTR